MNDWTDLVNFSFAIGGLVVALLGALLNQSVHFIDHRTKGFFTVFFALLAAYVASDLIAQISLVLLGPAYALLSKLAVFAESLFSSLLMPMLTMYLLFCAGVEWRRHPTFYLVSALWLAYFVLLVVTQFTTAIYIITPENVYQRGPLYQVLLLPPALLMLANLDALLRHWKKLSKRHRKAFTVYLLLPLACMLAQMFAYGLLMIVIGTCVATLIMFVFILREQMECFLRQQEEIARQQQEIAQERASILVLQMRPHFIYNTLMSIYSLINQDQQKARQVTADFTNYLRKNFNAVSSNGTVPFSAELEHTRAYLAVEQAQFEELLVVDFDTPMTQFRLPPLTLQPLAENAVKHGMDPYAGPLHVCVRTRNTDTEIEITVEDDGPGFDPSDNSKPHTTLENIRQRLAMMCGGTLEISTRKPRGTKVTIRIPVKQKKEDF